MCFIFKNTIKNDRNDSTYNNIFAARDPKTFCELVIEALDDLTMQILIVCAIISIILNGIFEYKTHPLKFWNEGLAILIAVGACTLVGAGNDYYKEKQFAEL
jgi:magnesium-transporting ATPase (P-type)